MQESIICGHQRPRSACASAQSDQGLRCLQTESLDTIECLDGEKCLDETFLRVQDDVKQHILCMLQGTFSLDRPIHNLQYLVILQWKVKTLIKLLL